jgi:hypothetical protein
MHLTFIFTDGLFVMLSICVNKLTNIITKIINIFTIYKHGISSALSFPQLQGHFTKKQKKSCACAAAEMSTGQQVLIAIQTCKQFGLASQFEICKEWC